MNRKINETGLAKLKQLEGFVGYAYDDADPATPKKRIRAGNVVRGTLTVGYGATDAVYPGMEITEAQATERLMRDIAPFERCVETSVKVPLSDNQFAALVIFAYNIGLNAFKGSSLLRELNGGNYECVPHQFMKWVKTTINGKKVISNGLVTRRSAEAGLWAAGAPAASSSVPVEPTKKKIITPESIAMATTAAAGIGSTGLTDGDGPVQYALAVIAVIAFVVGLVWFLKKRV